MSRHHSRNGCYGAGLACLTLAVAPLSTQAQTVAYYRFEAGPDGSTATNIVDSGPNGLNGTSAGTTALKYDADTPKLTGGSDNFSLNARGDLNFARVADNAALDVQGDLTVETFVRLDSPYAGSNDQDTIAVKRNTLGVGINLDAWSLYYVGGTGEFGAHLSFEDGSTLGTGSPIAIHDTAWHHLAFVLDRDAVGTTDTFTFFLDGVQQSQVSGNYSNLLYGTNDLILGAGNYATADGTGTFRRNFDGNLDEFRITAAALTPDQFLHAAPAPSALLTTLLGGVPGATLLIRRRRKR